MRDDNSLRSAVGMVVIGRNEGDRLRICLKSVVSTVAAVVYVDSGSTDGSVGLAQRLGAEVVKLDPSRPFTAARARNAGFCRLMKMAPEVRIVQFVDGDCEIREGWLARATSALEADAGIVAVCGRLRERYPERSVYIRMCDIGWDYPLGEIAACGGVAMYRVAEYAASGGFNEDLIAGEEFELCTRLREAGGRIVRIDAEMAWHDVGITRFGQWWKRAVRSGYAYAEGWALHSREAGVGCRRSILRAIFWGVVTPVVTVLGIAGAVVWPPLALMAAATLLLLIAQVARLTVRQLRLGRAPRDAVSFGIFLTLGKLPEAHGAVRYWRQRALQRRSGIIEYR